MSEPTVETKKLPVEAKELEKAVLDAIAQKIKVYPRRSLWASQLGHPCLRYNEYALTRFNDQQKHDAHLQQIFDEGNIHEQAVLQTLRDSGFQVRQSQRPLDEAVKKDGKRYKYNISGRLDTELSHPLMNGVFVPAEIKSASPYVWDSIETIEDIKKHKHYYIRGYLGQLNLYLYVMGREIGLFIFKNKVTGQLRFIWCTLDLALVEELLKNAEIINEVVERIETDPPNAESYLSPRIPYDEKICSRCAFNLICLPDTQFGGVEIDVDEATEALLRKREALKPAKQEFDEADEQAKAIFKRRGIGKYLVAASFNVDVKQVEKKEYTVAASTYVQVSIKALKGAEKKEETK
jgi:hypothetical protein